MLAALIFLAATVAAYLAHLWFDPHTLRGRWHEIYPHYDEPDPKACDPDAVTEYLRKHRKDR